MDCLVLPVVLLRRRSFTSRLGYRTLSNEDGENSVTVIVGKEKREFLVDRFVLEEDPFRVLFEMTRKKEKLDGNEEKGVIFVDIDAILFEHMLWLLYNDCSSLFQLNLKEIIDFYSQDA
ncbi:PREDICTED: uncharacterized protein LOC104606493 [Nelumbo nucifera]|uniref:Uncharacterized protein LOC104606493 n=2 Tax=Nelumbo nucifera TaxID=4432 RepID=A0A1U8AQS5_NELNU|nr:PREDICTED: uncharacterized protein LOC104606493 [Nelumbo nucifera]DAD47511.1 TPA_asm: hypothetical protein HUJ06_017448 [Nelumbo nucifera]